MYVVKSIKKLQLRVCVYLCVCVRKFALLSNSLLLRRRSILLQPTVSYSSPLKVICSPLPDHLFARTIAIPSIADRVLCARLGNHPS